MMKRAARAAFGLGVAVVLTVGLVEALLRIVHVPAVEIHRRAPARAESPDFFQYDPGLGWRGRAGAAGRLSGWEFTHDVRLNTRGFRDAEVAVAKPAGRLRIVLLGDSITWGLGVEGAERYGELLAVALRRLGAAVEVVNLAVSGYGTDQELLLWEAEGRAYCADLVLLGLYENDVRENMLTRQARYPKPYFRLTGDGGLALHDVPVPRVPDASPAAPPGGPRAWLQRHARVWAALAFLRQSLRKPDASATARPEAPVGSVELTAALVGRLAASVGRDGAAFAVVVLPDAHDSAAPREAAARSGVARILDLAPRFRDADRGMPLFYALDGAHWTPAGHARAAESIARWVLAAALLPPTPRTCAERS